MRKIRVKPIFGAHQIYQEIVNYPPEEIEYVGVSGETKKGKYYEKKKLKENIGRLLQRLKIPRMIPVRSGKFDLIHSSRGIIPLTKKPWVIDMEHVHSFFGLNPNLIKNKFWKKFIEKKLASKNCKAILCHCDATRQAFFYYLDCRKFKDKIKVLYPASHLISIKKVKSKKVRILALISLFEHKGGPQILEAFSRLEKKYKNIELLLRADVPKEFKEKYNSKNIKYSDYFSNILPREELLKKVYSQADIFLYPTFCDSFGYSLIDALISKLPVVTTNLFAVPEIVQDRKNGFIVKIPRYSLGKGFFQVHPHKKITKSENEEIINSIFKSLELLIKNKRLRERMGKESFNLVQKGKFSIIERNRNLRKIYEEAIK